MNVKPEALEEEYDPGLAEQILKLAKQSPVEVFDSSEELMDWLDTAKPKGNERIAATTEIGYPWIKGVYFTINKNLEEIDFDPRDRWMQLHPDYKAANFTQRK